MTMLMLNFNAFRTSFSANFPCDRLEFPLVVSGTMIAKRYDRYGRRVEIHHDCIRDVIESGCDFFCGLYSDTVLCVGIDRVIH